MELMNKVIERYDQLNENDLLIWRYIYQNPQTCKDISIKTLSDTLYLSTTTILSFIKKLGFNSFSTFKESLESEEILKLERDALANLHSNFKRNAEDFLYFNDLDLFKIINQAKNVYVYGSTSLEEVIARGLVQSFCFANKLFNLVEGKTEMEKISSLLNQQDVVIIYALEENKLYLEQIIDNLLKNKVKIISITGIASNYLSNHSTKSIFIYETLPYINDRKYTSTTQFFMLNDYLLYKFIEYQQCENSQK